MKLSSVYGDIELVQRANMVIKLYNNKELDPYTNKEISKETYQRAIVIGSGFRAIVVSKMKRVYGIGEKDSGKFIEWLGEKYLNKTKEIHGSKPEAKKLDLTLPKEYPEK